MVRGLGSDIRNLGTSLGLRVTDLLAWKTIDSLPGQLEGGAGGRGRDGGGAGAGARVVYVLGQLREAVVLHGVGRGGGGAQQELTVRAPR